MQVEGIPDKWYATILFTPPAVETSQVAHLPASAEDTADMGAIPGSRRSPGEGDGNPLQFSCQGNPIDREAWQVTVHGVANESDMT